MSFTKRGRRRLIFRISIWNWTPPLHIYCFWDHGKVFLRHKCGEFFRAAPSRNFSWDAFKIDLKFNRSWTTMKKYLNSNLYILYDDLKGYLLKRFDRSLFLSRTHIRSILYEKRKKGNDGRKSDRKCSWLISDGTMFRFMFRCLSISFREPTCLGADQKARGLWERDWKKTFVRVALSVYSSQPLNRNP